MAPRLALPTITLPTVTLPTVTVASLPAIDERLATAARDAAYVTIGLSVLAVQQADARRRDLVQALADRFDTTKAQVEEWLDTVEAQLRSTTAAVGAATTQLAGLVRSAS